MPPKTGGINHERSKRRKYKELGKNWESHIKKWRVSGMSKREYCRRENISYWAFRDKIKKQGSHQTTRMIKLPEDKYPWTDKPGSGIEIKIGDKISIEIRRGFDGELLRSLITELGVEK